MANNRIQIKRTTISGRTPNTTNSSNSAYIASGELAINLTDKKVYSSNGSAYFEVGSNVSTLTVTSIIANSALGNPGEVLATDGANVYWTSATGPQGATGYTGSSGATGYTGSQGGLGYTGSQGDIGYTGSQGDFGYTGSQGDLGYTGSAGANGYTGSQGEIGYTGSQGDQGIQGYTGSQGDLGYTGSQGAQGFTGSQGIQGYTGSEGYTGSQGVQGYTGSYGDIGPTGYTGSNGYTGSHGDIGYTGSQGDFGYTGSYGDLGYTGSQGDIGYTGSQGVIGYTGSEGTQGGQGYTGSQGDQGIQGYTGSYGDLGYTGSIGYTGSKGADGNFGGASFYYQWDNETGVELIANGYVLLTNANVAAANIMGISIYDRNGADISSFIQTIDDSTSAIKGSVKLTEEANTLNFVIFNIVDTHTDHGNHFDVPVSYVYGSTLSPANGTNIVVSFLVNGDRGDVGYTGSSGYTGSQGDLGYTGSQGDSGYTGSQGVIGYTGSFGYTGSQGDLGYAGSFGYTGSIGSIGYTGSIGSVGYTGSLGYSGSRGALEPWSVKTSTYTAIDGDRILADTTGGAFTINLPSSPINGAYVQISDANDFSLANVTVGRNGSTIEGLTDDVVLDLKGCTFEFIYNGSTWQVTATTGAQGYVGSYGYTGSRGYTGSQGPIGYTGSFGDTGYTGSFGSLGYTGSQGITGYTGSMGVYQYFSYPITVVTGTTQAANTDYHYVLTNAASTTVTLPGSPATGDLVWVTVANGRLDNIVARNGKNIQGLAEDLILDATSASVLIRYIDDTVMWRIV